jgi:hypothetical protein
MYLECQRLAVKRRKMKGKRKENRTKIRTTEAKCTK